jgi:hypothetical protein
MVVCQMGHLSDRQEFLRYPLHDVLDHGRHSHVAEDNCRLDDLDNHEPMSVDLSTELLCTHRDTGLDIQGHRIFSLHQCHSRAA